MVKQTKQNIEREINKLNDNETLSAAKYTSELPPSTRISGKIDNLSNDDLIVSLVDAYENKRARQVFEWEKVRRQNVQRAV